jgi:uncharacterized flavoprotein (TIGR03862 family)
MSHSVAVVGAGPAGLMAAEVLSRRNLKVDVFDAMPSAGRKLLLAGIGGLNISHSEPFEKFITRYGACQHVLRPILADYDAKAIMAWLQQLGIETFIGSSGRIFPKEMKSAPFLRAWLRRLRLNKVNFHMRHQWLGWYSGNNKVLRFLTPAGEQHIEFDAVVLALGGGSWPKLGSNGKWLGLFHQYGLPVAPLKPANCGFNVQWSSYFQSRFSGQPVKPVELLLTIDSSGRSVCFNGELIITHYGIEGSVVYAAASQLREQIDATGEAFIHLDLTPGLSADDLMKKLLLPQGKNSMANHLRKRVGLSGVKTALLREIAKPNDYQDRGKLGALIKSLPVRLLAPRPLAEAISSAGGVKFEALDDYLMLRAMPGVFCAGEMLDWEAPTGGYLLSACLATGKWAGEGVLDWLSK